MRGWLIDTIVAALVVAGVSGGSASATVLTFPIVGLGGTTTVDTGDITSATTSVTIPTMELVQDTGTTPAAAALAGIMAGTAATFDTNTPGAVTLSTVIGPFAFTLSVGDLTFSFTNISSVSIVPSGTPLSQMANGSISEQFNGMVTGDTSVGQTFLNQTVSLSQTCTQPGTGGAISCSSSLMTPGLPIRTPEPASLALFGLGLAGFGFMQRRKAA